MTRFFELLRQGGAGVIYDIVLASVRWAGAGHVSAPYHY